jgi:hypothetical protein
LHTADNCNLVDSHWQKDREKTLLWIIIFPAGAGVAEVYKREEKELAIYL